MLALEVTPLLRRVVVDAPGTVRRIGLTLSISHPRVSDLAIKLISPSGKAADIELAVDAMELAPHVDHIVIFSGDGDYRPQLEALAGTGGRCGFRVGKLRTASSRARRNTRQNQPRQCDPDVDTQSYVHCDRDRPPIRC